MLVLQNAGPHAAGMPEAGYLPIPKKLAQAGIKDMLPISDARMSGTAFGSVVLHVPPEAAVGGPLAAVRDGDRIRLSIENKWVDLLVDEAEIRRRLEELQPPPAPSRGYKALYRRTVTQAPEGCDFDFLAEISEETVRFVRSRASRFNSRGRVAKRVILTELPANIRPRTMLQGYAIQDRLVDELGKPRSAGSSA